MKIVCKMTAVLVCCETNRYTDRQTDRERGREKREANRDRESNEETSRAAQCLPCMNLCQETLTWERTYKSLCVCSINIHVNKCSLYFSVQVDTGVYNAHACSVCVHVRLYA